MKILIVAATLPEVKELTRLLGDEAKEEFYFETFNYKNIQIDMLLTGVGMVHTAYHLVKKFSKEDYDLVLNVGVAGSFRKEIPVGSVVNVVQEQMGDLGAEDHEEFLDVTDLQLLKEDIPPYKAGKLVNNTSLNNKIIDQLPKVSSISVNTGHGNARTIERTTKKYDPDIENMEGAAFFYVCLAEEIPFYEIRSITNYVKPRNKEEWDFPLALENLSTCVIEIIEELAKSRLSNKEI